MPLFSCSTFDYILYIPLKISVMKINWKFLQMHKIFLNFFHFRLIKIQAACTIPEHNRPIQLDKSYRQQERQDCTFEQSFESWSSHGCRLSDLSALVHRMSIFRIAWRPRRCSGGDRSFPVVQNRHIHSGLRPWRCHCRGCFRWASDAIRGIGDLRGMAEKGSKEKEIVGVFWIAPLRLFYELFARNANGEYGSQLIIDCS